MVEIKNKQRENNVPLLKLERQKTLQEQILEALPTIGEVCLLVLYIFGYSLLSLFRIFIWPIKPKPVREDLVLITGAGHGIGKELALSYASEGATVVCWDINKENNENTVKEIQKRGGPHAFSFVCDVSDRKSVFKVAKEVKETIGDVTILINNAGIMPSHSLLTQTEEEIQRTMDINVLAHLWTIQAFLPAMKETNHGHIVALSSIAGVVGISNLVPYCGAKFAVRGVMETIMEELRSNPNNRIKTTTICPYMVDTGLCKKPEIKFKNIMPLLDPKYVAKQIMFAQRTDTVEITIPRYLMKVNYFARLLPFGAMLKVRDFFSSGVGSDV